MKRPAILNVTLGLVMGTSLVLLGVEDKKANELLEAALTRETIQGDLPGAIVLYEQAVKEAGSNRALAAKAQLRLAAAYQKQGSAQAGTIYERVARDYSDQKEAAAEARSRLAAMGTSLSGAGQAETIALNVSNAGTPTTLRQITLFDRSGKVLRTVGDPGPPGTMALSPDGQRVALVRNGAIRVYYPPEAAGAFIPLTNGPVDNQPTWSADGKRIAFERRASNGSANSRLGIYSIPSDGGQEEFVAPVTDITLVSWSYDGRFMTYQRTGANTGADVWALPLFGDRQPFPVLATSAPEMGMRFSPDGRYISYRLTENNRSDVYVSPFEPNAATDPTRILERWKISVNAGVATAGVRWRADGKELFYLDANGGVTAVEVTTSPTFKAGTPKVLFQVPKSFQTLSELGRTSAGLSDVSADGRVFALMVPR
jgi:hypothetical protein